MHACLTLAQGVVIQLELEQLISANKLSKWPLAVIILQSVRYL